MSESDPSVASDPAKRHSAALTDGPDRAGARAMLKAIGFTDEDLAYLTRRRVPMAMIDPVDPIHGEGVSVGTTNWSGGLTATQYLVELPWGQEVSVFSQNMSVDGPLQNGDPVVLHWNPAHTFALDASQAADAGAEKIEGDE